MRKSKTPQEVFVLLLKQWDKWDKSDHTWLDGICLKLNRLKNMEIITDEELDKTLNYMELYHEEAQTNFSAYAYERVYWWPTENQKIRKQFVKFLSKQP